MTDSGKREKKNFLDPDGRLIFFMTKAGQVIILNVVWLLTCIPVFTIGTATTSLYYAIIKNIRRNRGYPLAEYFASFKRTFVKGSIFTVVAMLWLLLLYHLWTVALDMAGDTGAFLKKLYLTLMFLSAAVLLYLFPVLSRFTMDMVSMVKLSFVMSIRFIGYTILMLMGTAALAILWIYYLPMPVIFFLPGAWCYVCTFMIEKALKKYMPSSEGNEDAWYYE